MAPRIPRLTYSHSANTMIWSLRRKQINRYTSLANGSCLHTKSDQEYEYTHEYDYLPAPILPKLYNLQESRKLLSDKQEF